MTLVPAGHVLGSAQAVVALEGPDHGGLRRLQAPPRPDLPALRARPLRRLHHRGHLRPAGVPPPRRHATRSPACCARWRQFPERSHLVGAYALGKAQRIIRLLREAGWDRPIYVHGALERLNALYERHGIDLGPLAPATDGQEAGLRRPDHHRPARRPLQDRWSRRFPDPVHRLRLRLDAGPRPRPPARRRAAAGDLRPRRLGRTDRHRRRTAPRRTLDHPRPRGGAGRWASCTASRPGPWRWWATRKRTTTRCSGLRRTPRPAVADRRRATPS